jgi:putative transposase
MLTSEDFTAWCHEHQVPEPTQKLIQHIRSSEPARRVGGGRANVSGRYPSRKMGVTIQFESHRVELAAIYEWEHDLDVLEYYDQPPSFPLDYRSAKGRRIVVWHTPDYFVIRRHTAEWIECKTEDDLHRLTQHNPNRYAWDGERWQCPPGQAYASPFGLQYRVWSASGVNWVFQRNVQFLADYLHTEAVLVPPRICEQVIARVAATPGLSLQTLFAATTNIATRDHLYHLIATGTLYVDLQAAPLVEPHQVVVFPSKVAALAAASHSDSRPSHTTPPPPPVGTQPGQWFSWDGQLWRLLNHGETVVSLLAETGNVREVPRVTFHTLLSEQRMQSLGFNSPPASGPGVPTPLAQASTQDLQVANHRRAMINHTPRGEPLGHAPHVSARTLRRWRARYREAERVSGSGYLGLLPRTAARGNTRRKLPEATRVLMLEIIEKEYESLTQKTITACWAALQLACEARGLRTPNYKTFRLAIRQRAGHQQTVKRQGQRAAYPQEPFYWELDPTTPRHGDRPFEIGHIDHTELDLQTVCSQTGRPLGRPWLTLLIDAFSRRILAFALTYDPPSYRSCMMVIRECVHRHERLPQILVVDGGREFHSTYFETLLARYECLKKTRPPAKARFGSVCERVFGTTNTRFIYNLRGNTQLSRQPRQLTKSVDPKGHAVWSLAELSRCLAQYLYDVYDTTPHPTLGQSPRATYDAGLARTGLRPQRRIPYDQSFSFLTLPTTPRGRAKVVPGRGVKVYSLYYWSDLFRDPRVEGHLVEIRYDPFDAGTAYAFVQGRWTECHSEYYTVFRGRSEREMMLATQELRRRGESQAHGRALSAKQLALFLQSVEAEEVLLTQRAHDRESHRVQQALHDGPSSLRAAPVAEGSLAAGNDTAPPNGPPTPEHEPRRLYGAF